MEISKKIFSLRKEKKLSQSEFAELFGVSQQSVQRWESGAVLPDLEKLVAISQYFNISLDTIVLGKNRREIEIENEKKILPDLENATYWDLYSDYLIQEYHQCYNEGLDVEKYYNLFSAVTSMPRSIFKERIGDVVFDIVNNLEVRKDFTYNEPSDLETIKFLRKPYVLKRSTLNKEEMYNKVYGAWMGRVCGCALGKTVENCTSSELVSFLKETGNFPLERYIYHSDINKVDLKKYRFNFSVRSYVDKFEDFTPADDDTNYTVLSQVIIDTYGRDFTPYDVKKAWLTYQTRDTHCTAEKVAYVNFINGYNPPKSAMYKNPYREWIGAQIRADYFGYINPGNPEMAAEMAFRDACVSHTKNGIYGEMFIAAAIAIAAVSNDMEDIILGGLAQIPETSRMFEDVMDIYNGYKSGRSQKDTFKHIHEKYDEYKDWEWCFTNANTMIVVASLLYGKNDYAKSISMSVETGFDTDCNAATVGSVLGMANGIDSIPTYWKNPIKDKMETGIFGYEFVQITKCAEHTLEHIKYTENQ